MGANTLAKRAKRQENSEKGNSLNRCWLNAQSIFNLGGKLFQSAHQRFHVVACISVEVTHGNVYEHHIENIDIAFLPRILRRIEVYEVGNKLRAFAIFLFVFACAVNRQRPVIDIER